MATRSRGWSAGFGWLNRGISVGFRHPKPLFGGAVLLTLITLIPMLISLPIQFQALHTGTPMQPAAAGWITVSSMLLSFLVLPLNAGYLQMIDAAEHGLPARAGDIFKPYREGRALRLIGYGVLMLMVYFTLLAVVIAVTGRGVVHWYMQALSAQANHLPPPAAFPDGFGITLLLCTLLGIWLIGFYSIGLGQVALRDRSVFGAIGDGISGALKNVLPLLMLAVSLILTWIAVAIGFGIVGVLLTLIGKLVGPWVFVLIVPLYIALLLVAFTAMLGVMYHLWRDVCGDDIAPGLAQPIAA